MISDLNIKIDRDLCYACGICVDRCIMDNLRLHAAPCRTACPLQMNCQGYIRLIAQGDEPAAAQEMRNYLPFGGILGRVCHHPCEAVCERDKAAADGPVHIRALKRYLADAYPEIAGRIPTVEPETGKTVAIIGSGPAGLMAAHDLRSRGHAVTVFEAASEPGGLLRWGIPSFRLPVSEVARAVEMLAQMGIRFRTGEALGKRFELADIQSGYDAVLLAMGAGASSVLNIPGEDLEGVYGGLEFLELAKEGRLPDLGGSVIVIGGGNSAVDAALTCAKSGVADVRIVCLEEGGEMPAFAAELEEAREEGIAIENCWGPRRLLRGENGKIGVEVSRCLSVFDAQGAFCPTLENACSLGFEADSVIIAAGQRVKTEGIPGDYLQGGNLLAADPITLQSGRSDHVFCCGDAFTGPTSVVDAMAQGREAAVSIGRYLAGEGLRWGRDFWVEQGCEKTYTADPARAKGGPRATLERLPARARSLSTEIEKVLSPEAARREAERCLSCGRPAEFNRTCWFCLPCEIDCPTHALEVKIPYLVR